MRNILTSILTLLLVGCATIDPKTYRENDKPETLRNPGPMSVNVRAGIFLDLPEDLAEALELTVPKLRGDMNLQIRGELIERNPPRSTFTASTMIDLIDPRTGEQVFKFQADTDGEYDGTPTEGIGTALRSMKAALQGLTAGDLFHSILQERGREPGEGGNSEHRGAEERPQ